VALQKKVAGNAIGKLLIISLFLKNISVVLIVKESLLFANDRAYRCSYQCAQIVGQTGVSSLPW
jgi:hypothetical protein